MLATQNAASSSAVPGALPNAEPVPAQRQRTLAHAARHDILRRLAPALRHDMVVHLQSLGMMAEALSARLDRGATAPDDMQNAVAKLNRLSRQAVQRCLHVVTWMEPAEDDSILLKEGVDEAVALLRSSLNFRGFSLRSDVGDAPMDVGRGALRFLLAAAILTLTDSAGSPGELSITAETSATHAVLAVSFQPEQDGTLLHDSGEVPLSWAEVQALAAIEGAEVRRSGQAVVLRLPRAVATTPLKMVPV